MVALNKYFSYWTIYKHKVSIQKLNSRLTFIYIFHLFYLKRPKIITVQDFKQLWVKGLVQGLNRGEA